MNIERRAVSQTALKGRQIHMHVRLSQSQHGTQIGRFIMNDKARKSLLISAIQHTLKCIGWRRVLPKVKWFLKELLATSWRKREE